MACTGRNRRFKRVVLLQQDARRQQRIVQAWRIVADQHHRAAPGCNTGGQRGEILSGYAFQALNEEDQMAFAKLVRDQVPEKDQAGVFAEIISDAQLREQNQFKVK